MTIVESPPTVAKQSETPPAGPMTATRVGRFFENAARCVVLFEIVVLPWLFGGNYSAVEGIALLALLVAYFAWGVSLFLGSRTTPVVFPIVGLIVCAGVGLGVLQFQPLPRNIATKISATLVERRETMVPADETAELPELSRNPGLVQNSREFVPLSINPAETRHRVAILIWAAMVFVISANLFQEDREIRILLGLCAVNGGLLAFFGMLQATSWNGKLYGIIPLTHGGSPFGPYVNRNNAGGYLHLTIGCLLATLLLGFRKRILEMVTPRPTDRRKPVRPMRLTDQVRVFLRDLTPWQISLLCLAGSLVAGMLATLSRGALVSLIVTSGVLLCIAGWKQRLSRIAVIVVMAVCLGGIWVAGSMGIFEKLQGRLEDTIEIDESPEDRLLLWRDLMKAVPVSPWLGTGLGTFVDLAPPYHSRLVVRLYEHAENQFIETLMELGICGVVLLIGAIVLMFWSLRRLSELIIPNEYGETLALTICGAYVLLSQVICSLFDFGVLMPANMVLLASLCGVICGRRLWLKFTNSERSYSRSQVLMRPAMLLVTALGIAGVWAWVEERDAAASDIACQLASYEEVDGVDDEHPYPNMTVESLDKVRNTLLDVVKRRPDDANAHYHLGRLWILRYRLQAFDLLKVDRADLDTGDAPLWNMTTVGMAHLSAAEFTQKNDAEGLNKLRAEPPIETNLLPALLEFVAARRSAPWHAVYYREIGWLSFLGAPVTKEKDAQLIETADSLDPYNAENILVCGQLDFQAGRRDAAARRWRRAIALKTALFGTVADITEGQWDYQAMFDALLPDSVEQIVTIVRSYYTAQEQQPQRQIIALRLLKEMEAHPELKKDEYLIGLIAMLNDDFNVAAQHLQNSFAQNRRDPARRYDLARVLIAKEDLQGALAQAEVCVQLEPKSDAYRRFQQQVRKALIQQLQGPVESKYQIEDPTF